MDVIASIGPPFLPACSCLSVICPVIFATPISAATADEYVLSLSSALVAMPSNRSTRKSFVISCFSAVLVRDNWIARAMAGCVRSLAASTRIAFALIRFGEYARLYASDALPVSTKKRAKASCLGVSFIAILFQCCRGLKCAWLRSEASPSQLSPPSAIHFS